MKIALGQINPTVGDLRLNAGKMLAFAREAARNHAEVIAFPELSLCGYPPRDLVEKPSFLDRCEEELQRLALDTASLNIAVVCGTVSRSNKNSGKGAANSAVILQNGRVVFRQHKMLLPTYDVFDEARYFVSAERQALASLQGQPVAISICEDAWNDKCFWERQLYQRDPVEELMEGGAEVLISINGSPYNLHKRAQRREMFSAIARRYRKPVVYVNQIGGNDQLVFDGSSFAMDATGTVVASAKSFDEDLIYTGDLHESHPDEMDAAYEALVLGTRDYVRKCGFQKVLIGVSGGIDSALTACIAAEAVGRENVAGISMPGPFSSDHSLTDARVMCEKLGIRYEVSSISEACGVMEQVLAPLFAGYARDVTEENLQSRLRGVTLMALSNKWGALVLTTGNKSELAVGYCTLYGDMCGGLAVISDVPKTMVYALSRIANRRTGGAIPENVFIKPPSAELRPDQKDTDSLPEYDVLDAILKAYIEDYQPAAQIAEELKLDLTLVRDIIRKVDRNEYKRQQAAPGLKVTSKAFGIGRRMPVAQRFTE